MSVKRDWINRTLGIGNFCCLYFFLHMDTLDILSFIAKSQKDLNTHNISFSVLWVLSICELITLEKVSKRKISIYFGQVKSLESNLKSRINCTIKQIVTDFGRKRMLKLYTEWLNWFCDLSNGWFFYLLNQDNILV